jgi:hypothetical protein
MNSPGRRHRQSICANDITNSSIRGTPHYIATSLSKIYVVYTVPHAKYSTIAVATLDSVTGAIINHHHLDCSITLESELQVAGSHSSAPLAIWNEKGKLKVNILGSKLVTTLPIEVSSSRANVNSSMTLQPSQSTHHIPVVH